MTLRNMEEDLRELEKYSLNLKEQRCAGQKQLNDLKISFKNKQLKTQLNCFTNHDNFCHNSKLNIETSESDFQSLPDSSNISERTRSIKNSAIYNQSQGEKELKRPYFLPNYKKGGNSKSAWAPSAPMYLQKRTSDLCHLKQDDNLEFHLECSSSEVIPTKYTMEKTKTLNKCEILAHKLKEQNCGIFQY